VPLKKSVTPEYLICLEDGKKLKMLKRYLRSRYRLRRTSTAPNGTAGGLSDGCLELCRTAFRIRQKIGLGRSAPATKSRRAAEDMRVANSSVRYSLFSSLFFKT